MAFPFIEGESFIDGKHDYNNKLVVMNLVVENDFQYFRKCDSIAFANEWNSGYSSKKGRVFIKNILFQGGDENVVIFVASIYKPNT